MDNAAKIAEQARAEYGELSSGFMGGGGGGGRDNPKPEPWRDDEEEQYDEKRPPHASSQSSSSSALHEIARLSAQDLYPAASGGEVDEGKLADAASDLQEGLSMYGGGKSPYAEYLQQVSSSLGGYGNKQPTPRHRRDLARLRSASAPLAAPLPTMEGSELNSAMAVSGANGAAGPRSTRKQKLFGMRHGQRWDDANWDWIHEPRVRTWDPPLTEDGVEQARSAGEKLRSEGVTSSRIFVSPFLRCVQTAAGFIEGMYPQGSDMANLKVSVEYGLSDLMNRHAIWYPPADHRNIELLDKLFSELPSGVVDVSGQPVFPKMEGTHAAEDGNAPMKNRPTQHLEGYLRSMMRRLSDVQPGLARTCKAILQNFLKAKLSVKAKLSSDVWDTIFRYLRNVEDKVRSMQFGGRGVLNRVRHSLRSTIKLVLIMVLIGSTPAVGAIAPEAAELGPLRAGDSDKVSTLAFGLVACIGVLFTILGFLMSIKWCKRQSRNSTLSTPGGEILTRAARTQQKHTAQRWRKKEKVVVVVERS